MGEIQSSDEDSEKENKEVVETKSRGKKAKKFRPSMLS